MVVQAAKDYYDVLGVARNADKKAIKQAYRQKARKFHPVSAWTVLGGVLFVKQAITRQGVLFMCSLLALFACMHVG